MLPTSKILSHDAGVNICQIKSHIHKFINLYVPLSRVNILCRQTISICVGDETDLREEEDVVESDVEMTKQ